MRDQYAGDVSDVLKFAFLRALACADRKLGIAWYFVPGHDGRPDGRHLEWHDEPAWRLLDEQLHAGLRRCPNAASRHLSGRRSGRQASCFIANRCRTKPSAVSGESASEKRLMGPTSYFSIPTTASRLGSSPQAPKER